MFPCLALLAACETTPVREYPKFVDTSEDPTFVDTSDTSASTGDTSDTGAGGSDLVQVGFTGRIATVVGTPFDLDDTVADTNVGGFFVYDRRVVDSLTADDQRGTYDHRAGLAGFAIAVGGRAIAGSGNPWVEVDRPTDTFRWSDGPRSGDAGVVRTCTVDGVTDPEVEITVAFAGLPGADVLSSDSLPAAFPFAGLDLQDDATVTFSIEQGTETLLIELANVTVD